jgi:hypothetical protein
MAEIHTHDSSGQIHIETVEPQKVLTLNDFFSIVGQEIEPAGFALTATVNGGGVNDIGSYPLKDRDAVVLNYTTLLASETEEN